MIEWLQGVLKHSPEILLFLSLAIGFWIGQFQFGKFQFGGVAGSANSNMRCDSLKSL
ncbi:TPA: hypothetical protein ACSE7K_004055, partial [Acinetobacter baumannii]